MSRRRDLVLIMWVFCGFSVGKSEVTPPEDLAEEITCFRDTDCGFGDFCHKSPDNEADSGVCDSCGPLMTYNYEDKRCVYCPIFREKCYNNCCYRIDGHSGYEIHCVEGICQRCHKSDSEHRNCTLHSYQDITAKFIVAFAIAFSVALTAIIIYRWSFRGRRQVVSERRFSLHSETIFSPVQQRTQKLLQDRPPEYQTRHNYRHQQEAKAKGQVITVTCVAPPPYPGTEAGGEGATDSVQPPPYSRTEDEKTLHI